jgi:hypothetical protein
MKRYDELTKLACTWVLGALAFIATHDANAQWVQHADCHNEASAQAYRDYLVDTVLMDGVTGLGGDRTGTNLDARIATCRAWQTNGVAGPGGTPEQVKLDTCVARPKTFGWLMNLSPGTAPTLGLVTGTGTHGAGAGGPMTALTNANYYAMYANTPGGAAATVADELTIPACLQDATLFANLQAANLSDLPSIRTVAARIATQCGAGAIVLPYITQLTPGIDAVGGNDRHGRILVFLRNGANTISHYVQFTVSANPKTLVGGKGRQQASVLAYVTRSGAHVFDWKRNNTGAQPNTFTYDPNFGNNQQCYQCHIAGVLEIHPFTSTDDDIGNVAGTLGDGWLARVNALNKEFARALTDMNLQIRGEYEQGLSVLHSPTRTAARANIPNGLDLFPIDLTSPTGPACKKAVTDMQAAFTSARGWVTDWAWYYTNWIHGNYQPEKPPASCTSCHATRGSAIYNPWMDGGAAGFGSMLRKYIEGGYMPPRNMIYAQTGNGQSLNLHSVAVPQPIRRDVALCYTQRKAEQVMTWLKPACP